MNPTVVFCFKLGRLVQGVPFRSVFCHNFFRYFGLHLHILLQFTLKKMKKKKLWEFTISKNTLSSETPCIKATSAQTGSVRKPIFWPCQLRFWWKNVLSASLAIFSQWTFYCFENNVSPFWQREPLINPLTPTVFRL